MVAAAVAAGAAAGLADTAQPTVGDPYRTLKTLQHQRYRSVDISIIEIQPEIPQCRSLLVEELQHTAATEDHDLFDAALRVLKAAQLHAPRTAESIGVQLRQLPSGELEINDAAAPGAVLVAKSSALGPAFEGTAIRATPPPSPPTARD